MELNSTIVTTPVRSAATVVMLRVSGQRAHAAEDADAGVSVGCHAGIVDQRPGEIQCRLRIGIAAQAAPV